MQTTEQDLDVVSPAAATEEPDYHLTPAEADEIFRLAEAEIKPLLRKMRRGALVQNMLEDFVLGGYRSQYRRDSVPGRRLPAYGGPSCHERQASQHHDHS
jgi:hypothetical protein